MNCEEFSKLLHEFADGELQPPICDRVDSHLLACRDCARQARAVKHLKVLVRDRMAHFALPNGIEDRIRTRLVKIAIETEGDADRSDGVLTAAPRPGWARRLLPRSPMLRAASLVFAIAASVIVYSWVTQVPAVTHADVAWQSLKWHERAMAEGPTEPEIPLRSAAAVIEYLEQRFGRTVELPPFCDTVRFLGATPVVFHERDCARIFCLAGDVRLSVFALPTVPPMVPIRTCCFCPEVQEERYLVVCRAEGDVYFSMASDLSKDRFRELVIAVP